MKDYFDEGWNDAYKGYTKKDNPYKRFTTEWEQWRDGNVSSHLDDPYWINLKKRKNKINPNSHKWHFV